MKIEETKKQNILDFESEHNLNLEIKSRPKSYNLPRYIASFEKCEVKGIGVLTSSYGNGDTPTEAIRDYCQQLSREVIVIDAYTPKRREIVVPELFYEDEEFMGVEAHEYAKEFAGTETYNIVMKAIEFGYNLKK